jgi:hypothetical protein
MISHQEINLARDLDEETSSKAYAQRYPLGRASLTQSRSPFKRTLVIRQIINYLATSKLSCLIHE